MRIGHLDGLRGIAIIWVILFHSYSRWPEHLNFVSVTQEVSLFQYGFLGVQLFFMISGFVIFMTLDKSQNFIQFIKKRWLRLFPAMLIATILIYSTSFIFFERPSGIPSLINTLPGLMFTSPELIDFFTGRHISSLEGAFWSLYVEVIFYILIGAIYFSLGRKYCIPALFIAFLTFFLSFALSKLGLSSPYKLISALGFDHYAWFIVGCVVYEYMNNRKSLGMYLIAITSVILASAKALYSYNMDLILIAFYLGVLVLFISSFYIYKIQQLLASKLLLLVGFVSYPLYLIHENILISSLIKLEELQLHQNIILIMPLIISAILIALAYLIAKELEPRLRKSIEKILNSSLDISQVNKVKK